MTNFKNFLAVNEGAIKNVVPCAKEGNCYSSGVKDADHALLRFDSLLAHFGGSDTDCYFLN